MEYSVAELLITAGFAFLLGFAVSNVLPDDFLREAFYKAHPELKPAMVFTINGSLRILWYRYEATTSGKILATELTAENLDTLNQYYHLFKPKVGNFLVLDSDNEPFLVNAESFHKDFKRLLTED